MGAGKSKKVKNSKSSERDLIHIAMLGSGGVGKSALTVRYVQVMILFIVLFFCFFIFFFHFFFLFFIFTECFCQQVRPNH